MIRSALAAVTIAGLCAVMPIEGAAQITATPGPDDPRVQTLFAPPGAPARLVLFPDAPLAVLFTPGERVQRASLSDSAAFEVTVVGDNRALNVRARHGQAKASLTVTTDRQTYTFLLETDRTLLSAFVVRIMPQRAAALNMPPPYAVAFPKAASAVNATYRLKGNRALYPSEIRDDGRKTFIRWSPEQPLPAVLGIGPTGGEEIVNGYMRGDVFTIDRVYPALVLRIDDAKAEARRQAGAVQR